jgi:hypothetical protein
MTITPSGRTVQAPQTPGDEWVAFPGGELEGRPPRTRCPACRAAARESPAAPGARRCILCFACYRASLDRDRRLQAAGRLDTASEARFQVTLPLEPVNRVRLDRLRTARLAARAVSAAGTGRFTERRRRAQIEARHALQRISAGLGAAGVSKPDQELARAAAAASHAAALQLPESWLPFVVSR